MVWGLGVRCPWLPDYAAKLRTVTKLTPKKKLKHSVLFNI
ncbi:hypothetical protein CRENPOLYSF2_4020001 [Crenothrix polyspora]|uniref:Uncharacterized protein n=1 Tax=Crenothrix polyspora TaxID=360316 RepID=A0A1R4HE43_9GAMM|nr:hypothetical protein CRENPOLYSF2_4020001 [Crenothrix polyspora]